MAKQTLLDPRAVGRRIKLLREERGFSQRELSEPGISYPYISRIEHGLRTPSLNVLKRLAEKLEVSPVYLATGTEGSLSVLWA
jgi:transcriptional regulator with XRE-family HTH domain